MKKKEQKEQLAKKDFRIVQNKIDIKIKKGDNLNELNIPSKFYDNLKTEGVI